MIAAKRELADSGLLISACIVHAIGITVSWVLVFKFDVEIVSAKIWAVIALMWLLWLVVVALSPSRNLRKWIAAVIASSLILAPTVPTLYTFVVWTIEGFAP
jgi:cell division protein FtsW (lipid II flippase)